MLPYGDCCPAEEGRDLFRKDVPRVLRFAIQTFLHEESVADGVVPIDVGFQLGIEFFEALDEISYLQWAGFKKTSQNIGVRPQTF